MLEKISHARVHTTCNLATGTLLPKGLMRGIDNYLLISLHLLREAGADSEHFTRFLRTVGTNGATRCPT